MAVLAASKGLIPAYPPERAPFKPARFQLYRSMDHDPWVEEAVPEASTHAGDAGQHQHHWRHIQTLFLRT